jgi:hypothetical protein
MRQSISEIRMTVLASEERTLNRDAGSVNRSEAVSIEGRLKVTLHQPVALHSTCQQAILDRHLGFELVHQPKTDH